MPDGKPNAAESSAAAPELNGTTASLSNSVKDAWNKGENAPEPKPKVQESAPAGEPEETESEATELDETEETEAESAAESEPAEKPQGKDKDTARPERKGSKAERRIAQLTARLKELEAQVSKPAPRTEPTTEATTDKPKPAEAPKRPNPFKWTGTEEEYDAAMDAYETHLRKIVAADTLQQQAQQQKVQELEGKLAAANQRYGAESTAARIVPTADKIFNDPAIPGAVKAMLDDSPIIVDLLYTLSDATKLEQFLTTARTKPGQALREVALLEQLIQEELGKTAGKAKDGKAKAGTEKAAGEEEEQIEGEGEQEEQTPVVPVTRAPKPPSEVGGRGAPGEDSLVAAAHAASKGGTAKLSRHFKAEADRRYLAAHK